MNAMKWSSKKVTLLNSILLVMLLAMLSLMSVSFADDKVDNIGNNSKATTQQLGVKSPGTDLWRAVRNRDFDGSKRLSSTSQIKSMGANTFINTQGQEWRGFRMNKLIPFSMLLLGGILVVLALFRLIRGKVKIKAGRSGKKILRFSGFQRFVHWSVAILFIVLAITGTLLTFGRAGLVPLIGSKAFGTIAGVGKLLHDYLGPLFAVMLALMLFTFIKGNFGTWADIKWFFKGGGMFGVHASAGRYNAGEKVWFWIAMLVGAVVVISGLILDFPFFDQTRNDIELSHRVHAIASIGLLAVAFGHIFMGTVAMEGAYESMKTGYCDENWAKEHHDLWYADLEKQGIVSSSSSSISGVAGVALAGAGAGIGATSSKHKKSESNSSSTSSSSKGSSKSSSKDSEAGAQGLMDSGAESISSKAPEKKSTNSSKSSENEKQAVQKKNSGKKTNKAKPAPKSTASPTSGQADNLKKIEGIGPKIEEILNAGGITTFSKLSTSQYDDLKALLNEAGPRYKMHNPKTWPQQADLAGKGAWDELSKLQDRLLGGRE